MNKPAINKKRQKLTDIKGTVLAQSKITTNLEKSQERICYLWKHFNPLYLHC